VISSTPHVVIVVAIAGLGAQEARAPQPAAAQFFNAIAGVCGKAFAGRIVANQPKAAEDPFEGRTLILHVRTCEPNRVLAPFHVGEDRSRTFVITRLGDRLRFKHDHRHQDGSEDVLTMYGGDSVTPGTATRQEFPVDAESKALFTREKREVSNTNTWAMEVHPGRRIVYELSRPGRLFRVEFDLTRPVPTPPPAWGAQR
jgi:hypothetical protein